MTTPHLRVLFLLDHSVLCQHKLFRRTFWKILCLFLNIVIRPLSFLDWPVHTYGEVRADFPKIFEHERTDNKTFQNTNHLLEEEKMKTFVIYLIYIKPRMLESLAGCLTELSASDFYLIFFSFRLSLIL